MTPFLDLATHEIPRASRDEIFREFFPKLEAVRDDIEFDLTLWSLAQRLAVDTEELLRQIGERWLSRCGLEETILTEASSKNAITALNSLFLRLHEGKEAPLPGMDEFSVEVTSVDSDRVKISCEGARRCCSFVEGMARALCEHFGTTVRYLRQPKRATLVLITFSCIER